MAVHHGSDVRLAQVAMAVRVCARVLVFFNEVRTCTIFLFFFSQNALLELGHMATASRLLSEICGDDADGEVFLAMQVRT